MNADHNRTDVKRTVVLVGGGHTHALVLNAMRARPLPEADVVVINPGKTAPYSGMLPGFVAGHYTRSDLDIDLVRLTQKVGAKLIDARAIAMDGAAKMLTLDDGTQVAFDLLSFDVGITSRMKQLTGFEAHATPAKPLGVFASRWEAFRAGTGSKRVVIIGGGIAGAELAMAMAFALRSDTVGATVKLLDRGTVLSANSDVARGKIMQALFENKVDVIENAEVVEVTPSGVVLADKTLLNADLVIGAAGATPHSWVADTGLALHEGFITVDRHLKSSNSDVFATGDCAYMAFDPRPKAGVFAVRQAPVLLENLRRTLNGDALQSYAPQSDYLKLVSLGGKVALGEKIGRALSGRLVWKLKDRIDRTFMKQF